MGFLSVWLGFFGSTECTLPGRLDGRVAVITGANNGIGLELTAELARRGAQVTMLCRSMEKFQSARDYLLFKYGQGNQTVHEEGSEIVNDKFTPIEPGQLRFEQLDLSSFESVKQCARALRAKESTVCFLVNNAGVLLTDDSSDVQLTADGFNYHIQVNFLSPLLLTLLLLPLLSTDGSSRIVFTSSVLRHLVTLNPDNLQQPTGGLLGARTYAHSKMFTTACARQLATRLKSQGIRVVSVDPGIVRTSLVREPGWIWNLTWNYLLWPLRKDTRTGAQCTLHTLLDPDLISGAEYCNCVPVECSSQMQNEDILTAVWLQTMKILLPHLTSIFGTVVERLCMQ